MPTSGPLSTSRLIIDMQHTEQPRHLSYKGKSMWPCFQEGDILELTTVAIESLQVGDCISFREIGGNSILTHRICSLRDGLQTRGDARPFNDDCLVEPDRILGKVTGCIRLGAQRSVCGGWQGRILAIFYHYTGRIEPQRASRGGCLARSIRAGLQWRARSLYQRGEIKSFPSTDGKLAEYWLVDGKIRSQRTGNGWHVPWPWSLLLDETRLTRLSR